jgi:metal iron transporter
MNCPSRTDEPEGTGFNQNPNLLAGALTTRNDLNGIANSRLLRRNATTDVIIEDAVEHEPEPRQLPYCEKETETGTETMVMARELTSQTGHVPVPGMTPIDAVEDSGEDQSIGGRARIHWSRTLFMRLRKVVMKFGKFLGPGFMVCAFVKSHLSRAHHVLTRLKIAVAYIDPGNYSTDVAAGATYRFQLLFIVFMSNVFAIFLQSLCIKLGSVSGLNLAEACREFLPKWLNITLYIMAEAAVRCSNLF